MRGVRETANPFQPGAGALPPVLAGRGPQLDLARKSLETLASGRRPSRNLLFFGPRGNGKTVLLARIAELARRREMRVEEFPADCLASREMLVRHLRELAGLTAPRLSGAQLAGFGFSAEPAPLTGNLQDLFFRWIGARDAPLVVLLDEVQTVQPEGGRALFAAVQQATTRALPLLLLAAGTPNAPARLRACGTYTERMFQRVRVNRLGRDATVRALAAPASAAGRPFQTSAVHRLAAASQDYPYFIQLLGRSAWKAAAGQRKPEVGMDSAQAGIAAVRPQIDEFYDERLDEARSRRIAEVLVPLASLFRARGNRPLNGLEVGPVMDDLATRTTPRQDPVRLLGTLSDLGILWRSGSGWEMGIPSFGDYLLELAAGDGPPPG